MITHTQPDCRELALGDDRLSLTQPNYDDPTLAHGNQSFFFLAAAQGGKIPQNTPRMFDDPQLENRSELRIRFFKKNRKTGWERTHNEEGYATEFIGGYALGAGSINRIIVTNNPVNWIDPDGLIVLYSGFGGAAGAGYKVKPNSQDPVSFVSGTVVRYKGTNRNGGISTGMAISGGAGRMLGASAGGGALVGINFGDVEDIACPGTSTGLLLGPFSIEFTFDGRGSSMTGFSFGFLNKGFGLGAFGQETRTAAGGTK